MKFAQAILLASLTTIASSSASKEPLTAGSVLEMINRSGARATVDELWRTGRWDRVEDHIAAGESAWIALAIKLAPGTDAGAAEGLSIVMAEALPKQPAKVLAAIDLNDGSVLGASSVCGAPFIEESPQGSPAFLRRYLVRAPAAVASVHDERLEGAKRACLAALRDAATALHKQPSRLP
jgi:hypothetical protein